MSDIRVFVTFPESTAVFAGETLQCKITFKNVSPKPGSRGGYSQAGSPTINGHVHPGDRTQKSPPLQIPVTDARRSGRISPRLPLSQPPSASYKSSHSHTLSSTKPPASPTPSAAGPNGRSNHKHKRSVSIVSLSSDVGIESGGRGNRDVGLRSPSAQSRPRGHGRSASLQIAPGRHPGVTNGTTSPSATMSGRSTQTPPTPLVESDPMSKFSFPARGFSTHSSPISPGGARYARSQSVSKAYELSPAASGALELERKSPRRIRNMKVDAGDTSQLNKGVSQIDPRGLIDEPEYEQIASARVIPAQSIGGDTPRSSGEFYSMSNSTTETLLSEYDPKASSRLIRSTHNRRHSLLSIGPKLSESLMMGYAQVTGSFTLDGSLVQTNIFEEVKRRGVVGTQNGGGVVGIETSKADGGFLSGFGWGLGGGFGGLLGGSNMSSIAEMKNIASTKSIPILSTPQSILFVDLRLSPGESRTYMYKFTLPRGIPPSHRGKAIKITYNLVLGTQRPGKGVVQPTVIEIPFRVFPNVNGNGSLHTHDLMSPIVLLRDEATIACMDEPREATPPPPTAKHTSKQESSLEDFLSYVDSLLAPQDNNGCNASGSLGLLSPSYAPNSKRLSIWEDQPTTCKDVIEMAILGGNAGPSSGSCSIFEIARNGHRVAAITMARPAYKLGESIAAVVDFTNSEIPCYHIHASLESSEKVDTDLALRSASSIHRATRKVYAQHSESTLFANRIIFTPTIPSSASPEFSTSGVSNSWVLRFEFITSAISSRAQSDGEGLFDDLLEQTYADDRGELYEPRQGIFVESFDASIPVKIYPNGSDPGTTGGVIGVQASTAASVGFVV
ncbi:Rgp1-domain-containing protein [Wilcoxina mikolae CBS 423.85]|nr:Rgp1-domain-containing protein [Wilcoxina mikolae CBS 423.85]